MRILSTALIFGMLCQPVSVNQLPPNPYTCVGEDGQVVVIGDEPPTEDRPHLTKSAGTFLGPSGKETWYNLNMNAIVTDMRNKGYSEEEYPYWVREDGCKMLGEYVMVAANLNIRPKGTVLETSLGPGLVCDTGTFASSNVTQIDIAVTWKLR